MTDNPRSLAPDVARGAMLLLIALANVSWFLYGRPKGLTNAHAPEATGFDAVWQTIVMVMVDGRSYPLFAFLFGYGIWQLYRRQQDAGVTEREARCLMLRRNAWLLAFGVVHAALLWYGDVLGAYGIVGLLVTWLFLRRSDKTIAVWFWVFAGLLGLYALFAVVGGVIATLFPLVGGSPEFTLPNSNADPNYVASILARLGEWSLLTPVQALTPAIPAAVLAGIRAARRGVLDRPLEHVRLLRRSAATGIAIGWLGGAVTAVNWYGGLGLAPKAEWATAGVHGLTGLAAGLGYAACFGLLAARAQARGSGPVLSAFAALGKRSLSGYVSQSVLFALALPAWTLGWGAWMSSWQGGVYAIAAWFVTVVLAVWLDRTGRRGPLEVVLRRLAYGRRPVVVPTPVTTP